VPAIAAAEFAGRVLQQQHGGTGLARGNGRAQGGVPASGNQYIVGLVQADARHRASFN